MTKLKWKKTLYLKEITSRVPRALGGGTYAISDEGTHGFSVWLHRRVIGQTATRDEAIALAQAHHDDRLSKMPQPAAAVATAILPTHSTGLPPVEGDADDHFQE